MVRGTVFSEKTMTTVHITSEAEYVLDWLPKVADIIGGQVFSSELWPFSRQSWTGCSWRRYKCLGVVVLGVLELESVSSELLYLWVFPSELLSRDPWSSFLGALESS
jgi:hypothetical protein